MTLPAMTVKNTLSFLKRAALIGWIGGGFLTTEKNDNEILYAEGKNDNEILYVLR